MNEIYVDKEGYEQFIKILEKLKNQSLESSKLGGKEYENAVGDGWHDNFAFEDTMRESRKIARKIDNMIEDQKHLKIVEDKKDKNKINIGDIVKIEIKYSDDDSELQTIKLTGKYTPNNTLEIPEITLNSSVGRAIYNKKINDNNIYYMVKENKIEIKVLEVNKEG